MKQEPLFKIFSIQLEDLPLTLLYEIVDISSNKVDSELAGKVLVKFQLTLIDVLEDSPDLDIDDLLSQFSWQ